MMPYFICWDWHRLFLPDDLVLPDTTSPIPFLDISYIKIAGINILYTYSWGWNELADVSRLPNQNLQFCGYFAPFRFKHGNDIILSLLNRLKTLLPSNSFK